MKAGIKCASVILAAGEGTRMHSPLPKVLHPIAGKPMIEYVLDTVLGLGCGLNCVIVGFEKEKVMKALDREPYSGRIEFVFQDRQLGSGHAVLQSKKIFSGSRGDVLVTCGDVPLLKLSTLGNLLELHRREKNSATVLTARVKNPSGYGRIVTDGRGGLCAIVEEKDASPAEKSIGVINTGIYCFNARELFSALDRVKPDNSKQEYYITDVIGIMRAGGKKTGISEVADIMEVSGINTPGQLAEVQEYLLKNSGGRRNKTKCNTVN